MHRTGLPLSVWMAHLASSGHHISGTRHHNRSALSRNALPALQVEVAAPSAADLAAWEARVCSKLARLARYTARPVGSVHAEALLHAFGQQVEQDAAGEGSSRYGASSGEVQHSLFFLGVAEKEVGSSWQLAVGSGNALSPCMLCPSQTPPSESEVQWRQTMSSMPCQWPACQQVVVRCH